MKKAPLYILIISVAVIVSILGYALYLNFTEQPSEQSALGVVCAVVFLVFAFVAVELLFKPHLFLRPREEAEETEEESEAEEVSEP